MDLLLTTNKTGKTQTFMHSVGFELGILTKELLQIHALDGLATGTGNER